MTEPTSDIDIVYLWVDGSDPAWQAKRNALVGGETMTAANCKGRYANNDELRYSLRSVAEYAPWIRRIFIVTDGQKPAWLDTSHPKIRLVDHSEILPEESRPCFNSVVIEHCLWRIPDLSEKFLLANDDMLFAAPVKPSDFFTPDGLPIVRLNRKRFRKLSLMLRQKVLRKKLGNYNLTIMHAADLVARHTGVYFGSRTHHNIDSYLLSDYRHTFDTFAGELTRTLTNHVRSDSDIQRQIYSYLPLAEHRARLKYVNSRTSFRLQIHERDQYARLEQLRPTFLCLNDSQMASDDDRRQAATWLASRFPTPSPFEIARSE